MFQALIHFKNDEEIESPVFSDFYEALQCLSLLIQAARTSDEGFDPEDVQFAQVQFVEGI